jgi:palmitoyltransferase ZDHHC1/11
MQRKNGFTQRMNCEQILSICIGLLLICIYYIIIIPILKSPLQAISSVLYSLLTLSTVFFAALCSYIDPAADQDPYSSFKFCTICQRNVSYTSKHCARCNRCVARFDHHCVWINNCVGERNYKQFIYTIVCLEGFMMYQLGSSLYIIVALSCREEEIHNIFQIEVVYVLMGISCLFSTALCVSNGILIGFHAYIRVKKVTTYEYIIEKRKRTAKVRGKDELSKYYEPYLDASKSESMELSRAPKFLHEAIRK